MFELFKMDNTLVNKKRLKHRNPGKYQEKFSIKKKENNVLILHACKLLNAYYNNEGIIALILDAEEMNTTNSLLRLESILKKIIIVENNKETFDKMKEKIISNNLDKIELHKGKMDLYLENDLNPEINVVYFDLNESFFSSKVSYGSDYAINLFLRKSEVNQIVFAATFCLRSRNVGKYDLEEKKILLFLEKIFRVNGFKSKLLIRKKDMRYKGQKAHNKALMFVLFFLDKYVDNNFDN